MKVFIHHIKEAYANEPYATIAVRTLECLIYIENNYGMINQYIDSGQVYQGKSPDKEKGVLRADNGMSFHVKGYKSGGDAVKSLTELISQMQQAIRFMTDQNNPLLIRAFINCFSDSDVGCMEERVAEPLNFVTKLRSMEKPILPLQDLLVDFFRSQTNEKNELVIFKDAIYFFKQFINLPIIRCEGGEKLLTWEDIKNAFATIYELNIKQWPRLQKDYFSEKITEVVARKRQTPFMVKRLTCKLICIL